MKFSNTVRMKGGVADVVQVKEGRRGEKMVKADRECRMLLGNGDEMLMCLILMHCSKVSEEGEAERKEREGRRWADLRNREARMKTETE